MASFSQLLEATIGSRQVPTLRIARPGAASLSGLGYSSITATAFNQVNPNRYTGISTSESLTMTYTVTCSRNAFLHQLSIQNQGSVGDATHNIVNWDFQPFVTQFPATPGYDGAGANLWVQTTGASWGNQGWYTDGQGIGGNPEAGGPCMTFFDGNVWQTWYTDDPVNPIGFHFAGKFGNPGPHWVLFVDPTNHGPGANFCDFPILSGTTLSTSFRTLFYPNAPQRPNATVTVPQSYASVANRWPYQINLNTFPNRTAWCPVFLASWSNDGLDWSNNPRRWQGGNQTINGVVIPQNLSRIWNPATGHLWAQDGDYSGLTWFKNKAVGLMHFATDVCMAKVPDNTSSAIPTALTGFTPGSGAFQAAGILAWDLWWGQQYPQQDPSYLGDPATGVVANLSTTVSPVAAAPELTYTDENFPVPIVQLAMDAMGVGSDGTVYPNFIKGIGMRADYLTISATLNPTSNFLHSAPYATLGNTALGLTVPNRSNDPSLFPSSVAASSGTYALGNYPAFTAASNQP